MFKGGMAKDIAEILLYIDTDHLAEAEGWIRKAIEADEQNGMRWQLACDYGLYADFFQRKTDNRNAQENYSKAISIYGECGANGWVKKYEKKLAEL